MEKKAKDKRYIIRVLLIQSLVMIVFIAVLFAIKQINPKDYKSLAVEYLKVADVVDIEQHADEAWNNLKAVLVRDSGESDGSGGEDEKVTDNEYPPNCSASKYVVSKKMTIPVKGSISCVYGHRIHPITKELSFHTGVDIAADNGDDIRAAYCGKVIETGKSEAYGNYVYLSHGDGVLTFYAHCSKLYVSQGEIVDNGQTIASVGSTGWSTGPHLHFGIKIDGIWYNPEFAMKG